jgi:hypothetical protein
MQLLSLTLYNFVCRSETVDDPCYFQSDKMSYYFFKMGYRFSSFISSIAELTNCIQKHQH